MTGLPGVCGAEFMALDPDRFLEAQSSPHAGMTAALAELGAGRKTSHWIWYVFPQIEGLGRSGNAHHYALGGLMDAVEYLRHPVLRERLLQVTAVVDHHLSGSGPGDRQVARRLRDLMGGEIDARKLVSSLTLFQAAAAQLLQESAERGLVEFKQQCSRILTAAAAQGYPRCAFTLERVRAAQAR